MFKTHIQSARRKIKRKYWFFYFVKGMSTILCNNGYNLYIKLLIKVKITAQLVQIITGQDKTFSVGQPSANQKF